MKITTEILGNAIGGIISAAVIGVYLKKIIISHMNVSRSTESNIQKGA